MFVIFHFRFPVSFSLFRFKNDVHFSFLFGNHQHQEGRATTTKPLTTTKTMSTTTKGNPHHRERSKSNKGTKRSEKGTKTITSGHRSQQRIKSSHNHLKTKSRHHHHPNKVLSPPLAWSSPSLRPFWVVFCPSLSLLGGAVLLSPVVCGAAFPPPP